MSKMYINTGVDRLISAVISNAISTYLVYQNHIKKLDYKLLHHKYEGKIRYRYDKKKDKTLIFYVSSEKAKENDLYKIDKMQGECDYILRWFGSKDFDRLTQGDYNGQYFIEILENCDGDTWEKIRKKHKNLIEQEIDVEESLND